VLSLGQVRLQGESYRGARLRTSLAKEFIPFSDWIPSWTVLRKCLRRQTDGGVYV